MYVQKEKTPLHTAVSKGRLEIIELILSTNFTSKYKVRIYICLHSLT